ncbi:MAG: hypothetical protein WCW47_03300 [Candidatus Paceibacterota bacterium]|jgi:hypothetical protein
MTHEGPNTSVELRLPENLDEGKRAQLGAKLEEYDGVTRGSAVGFSGWIKRLRAGNLAKAEYKAIMMECLLEEGSVNFDEYREMLEGLNVGFSADDLLWSIAVEELQEEVSEILSK